jgi:ubiquitin-protein ligase
MQSQAPSSLSRTLPIDQELRPDNIPPSPPLPFFPRYRNYQPFKRVTIPTFSNTNSKKQLLMELKEMNTKSFSNDQLKVEMIDENPYLLKIIVTPDDGLYCGGYFEFKMTIPPTYPSKKPTISCLTPIFHPNIKSEFICFSILENDDPQNRPLRIADYVHGLLWLLYYPNLNSRFNLNCPENGDEFERLVRCSIEGGDLRFGDEVLHFDRSVVLILQDEKKKNEKLEDGGEQKSNMDMKRWKWVFVEKEWRQVFLE